MKLLTVSVLLFVPLVASAAAQATGAESRPATPPGEIGYMKGGNVWVCRADGTEPRQLTDDCQYDRPIAWSPDGRQLVHWVDPAGWNLRAVDVVTGAKVKLTTQGEDSRSAAWSSDGKQIAFMKGPSGLWVMKADGSEAFNVSPLGFRDEPPSWHPAGSALAYTHLVPADETHVALEVHVVTLVDRKDRLLVHNAEEPAWSPDGKTIAVAAASKGRRQITLVDPKTAVARVITSSDERKEAPAWSPDGTRLAWLSWAGESGALWICDAQGDHAREVAGLKGRPWQPSWSPDGKWIALGIGDGERADVHIIEVDGPARRILRQPGATCALWRPAPRR